MTGMPASHHAALVIVAAGQGVRFGSEPKVLALAGGRPLISWSLTAAAASGSVREVVIVTSESTEPGIRQVVAADTWPFTVTFVPGGQRRQDSVVAGLRAVSELPAVVLVHDGARPLASAALLDACAVAAFEHGAAIAATPVSDTLKHVTGGWIDGTVSRESLWAAQTPQAMRRDVMLAAIERASALDAEYTDEASLLEAVGQAVWIVPGERGNIKVTHREDLELVDAVLRTRIDSGTGAEAMGPARHYPRTGIGYDVHRFTDGRRLVLGGVEIPYSRGLEGHSDADVLLHAITDALLGAAALGDIGHHFPPGDDRWKDADSRDLLRQATDLLRNVGWKPVNVDASVVAEAPRVIPYTAAMRLEIREATGLPIDAISIKATTNERMGFVGREEGIAAMAVATIAPLEAGEA